MAVAVLQEELLKEEEKWITFPSTFWLIQVSIRSIPSCPVLNWEEDPKLSSSICSETEFPGPRAMSFHEAWSAFIKTKRSRPLYFYKHSSFSISHISKQGLKYIMLLSITHLNWLIPIWSRRSEARNQKSSIWLN